MNIEAQLRQTLLPVFGLTSIDQIPEQASLVRDLGADSLDFVEIVYLIERDFGVVLKTNELVLSGAAVPTESLFVEGRLTGDGAALLRAKLPERGDRFCSGMTKVDLFQTISVRDLADIIRHRRKEKGLPC